MTTDLGKIEIQSCNREPIDIRGLNEQYDYSSIENHHEYRPFCIDHIQNYNPIYSKLFDINDSNQQSVCLKHRHYMQNLGEIEDITTREIHEQHVFVKFSPLLDPIRYMIGKYPIADETIRTLPQFSSKDHIFPKLADPNNASYIDGFFSYLSSQLLEKHGFLHGIDYYGSYLGIQEKFKMNITDDIEYLSTSDYFNNNVGKHFFISDELRQDMYKGMGSRSNKHKLSIQSLSNQETLDLGAEVIDDMYVNNEHVENIDGDEIVYEKSVNSTQSSTDSSDDSDMNYSSDEADSDEADSDEADSDEADSDAADSDEADSDEADSDEADSDEAESSISSTDGDDIYAFIPKFPVQMICLEKCAGTFDELLDKGVIDECEGASALFQIVMTLLVYQRAFSFTHNDLHTNNIMYVNTDVEYLYYMWENRVYRVPTYGKIYKIIDFGRSIYRYGGKTFCSDSFATGGDAATQYNCEPYLNEKKPRLDPNPAFDLCRLGCSMYDFLIEDESESDMDDYQKTVARWCKDDDGRNVLYKRNGEERYPNFKLYKMIARIVHHHTPREQLKMPFFAQFLMTEAERNRFVLVDDEPGMMNIDAIPSYM